MNTLFQELLEGFKENDINGEIDSSDGTETLRIMPDGMGEEQDGLIIMEVCKVPYDGDEGHSYYQCYTTIAKDLDENATGKILTAINEINLRSLIGYYGVLSEYNMLYHKHIARVPNEGIDLKDYLEGTIYSIILIIDNDYEDLFKAIFN